MRNYIISELRHQRRGLRQNPYNPRSSWACQGCGKTPFFGKPWRLVLKLRKLHGWNRQRCADCVARGRKRGAALRKAERK